MDDGAIVIVSWKAVDLKHRSVGCTGSWIDGPVVWTFFYVVTLGDLLDYSKETEPAEGEANREGLVNTATRRRLREP